MPSTVNGIGTHYYGRKNRTARTAACASCNRVTNLESYDTRLWFVVVFIPVIPLGRKRIIDQCPACTRHYVMKADVYEQTKQLQTSGSLDRFRREPSADSAIEAHGQFLAFHEHDQAADFRRTALDRIPDHAAMRAAFAAQLRDMSSFEESAALFREALELDPELPEARVGVAHAKMAAGDLDGAKELLDFLKEPGEGQRQSLVPLDILSGQLQAAGRHEEAMEIAEVLLRELPKIGDHHAFRAFVKRSEKALGRPDSILPERGFSVSGLLRSEGSHYPPWLRKTVIGGIATALVLGGLALNNEYIRRHRTIHVVNATNQGVQVQVDNGPAVSVSGMGTLTVAEGPHVLKVSGPVNETVNVALDAGYFDRWFHKPAWVLNPGGEAVLQEITHVYSANGIPSQRRMLVGESFVALPQVDYIFTDAPSEMRVKNKSQEITKIELGLVQAEDANAFLELIDANRAAAMDFAEKRLRRNPNQADLLKAYVGQAADADRGRIEAFLKTGLDRRPVDVAWQRAYQSIAELNGHEGGLVSDYDKALAAEPSSAALLYLRGRIDPDWDAQESYYRRSVEADPKFGWPWIAFAARAGSAGRWDDCLAAALKARELRVDEPERIAEFLHESRMAKGEASALVDEYRAAVNANSQNVATLLFLVDALAASGKEGEIDGAINAWVSRLPFEAQGQVAPHLRALGLYYAGKLQECVGFCGMNPMLRSTPAHLHALLGLGRMKEASDESTFGAILGDPLNSLAVSVGFGLDGKPEDAGRWREKAVAALKKVGGASDIAKAGKILEASAPPSIEEVGRIYFPPANKAVILAALADRFPDRRGAFLAEAAKFNVTRKPSYHLIVRATEKQPAEHP